MKSTLVRTYLTLVFCAFTLCTAAQTRDSGSASGDPKEYRYFPDSKLALGWGFSPSDLGDVKRPCIVFDERPLTPGAASTHLSAQYVKNLDEEESASNLDAKASADFLEGSASAHFNSDTTENFSQTTINVVVKAVTDYGEWAMKAEPEPKLNGDAQGWIDTKHFDTFEKNCGSRYVSMERRASSAGVVISISEVKSDTKEAFEADASGNYGMSGMSASASGKFSSELKSALAQNRVSFEVFSTGGEGFSSLGEIVKSLSGQADPMEAIMNGLAQFMEKFSKTNAALYSFSVSSMDQFGWIAPDDDIWTDNKEATLRTIVASYRNAGEVINHITDFKNDGVWRKAICQEYNCPPTWIQFNINQLPSVKDYQLLLKQSYISCKDTRTTTACSLPIPDRSVYGILGLFETPPPPAVKFMIIPWQAAPQRSLDPLLGHRARAVLDASEENQLTVMKAFSPQADFYEVRVSLQGKFLDTEKVIFVDSEGEEKGFLTEGPPNDLLWISSGNAKPDRQIMKEWLASFTSEGQSFSGAGTFYLDVTDRLNRIFRFPLLDVAWSSQDGKLVHLEEHYDYLP